MSLTLKAEQMLIAVGLVEFFDDDPDSWRTLAKETYGFVVLHFGSDAVVRRDDVAGVLVPLLEVNEPLGACLQEKKLKQRYWIAHFADLILDRSWDTIGDAV